MAAEAEINDGISTLYHAAMADRTLPGVVREAVKDIRSTIMDLFFSKPERGSEPGTPLSPLFTDQVAARNYHRSFAAASPQSPQSGGRIDMPTNPNQPVPSVSEILASPQAYLATDLAHGGGQQHGHNAATDPGQAGGPPSVSEILNNPQAYLSPEQQHGNAHQHDHGMSM